MNIVVGKEYLLPAFPEGAFTVVFLGKATVVVLDENGTEHTFGREYFTNYAATAPTTFTVTGYLSIDGTAFLSESELKEFTDAGLHPDDLGRKVNATFTYLEE